MILVAPLPKKPSSVHCVNNWLNQYNIDIQDVEDACMELQHILKSSGNTTTNNYITRTGNPLVQDSSFIPLHQAVSQLSVSNTGNNNQELLLSSSAARRPRSFSVGQRSCKPIY